MVSAPEDPLRIALAQLAPGRLGDHAGAGEPMLALEVLDRIGDATAVGAVDVHMGLPGIEQLLGEYDQVAATAVRESRKVLPRVETGDAVMEALADQVPLTALGLLP